MPLIIAKFCNVQAGLFLNLPICRGDINFEVGRDIFGDPFIQKFFQIRHPQQLWVLPNALPSPAALSKTPEIGLSRWFFYIKIHPNLSWHFSMKIIKRLGFFKDDCLVSLILKTLYLLNSCWIFLGGWKASQSI